MQWLIVGAGTATNLPPSKWIDMGFQEMPGSAVSRQPRPSLRQTSAMALRPSRSRTAFINAWSRESEGIDIVRNRQGSENFPATDQQSCENVQEFLDLSST